MNNKVLLQKLKGFIESINKMSERERSDLPSDKFGIDYNQTRALVQRLNPDLELVMPPAVDIEEYGQGMLCSTKYSEIHTFCTQMVEFLADK